MFNEEEITRGQLAVIFPVVCLASAFAVGYGLRKLNDIVNPQIDPRIYVPKK